MIAGIDDPLLSPLQAAGILGALVLMLTGGIVYIARDYLRSLKGQISEGAATRKVLEDLTKAIDRMAAGIEERAKMTAALLENQQLTLDAINAVSRSMVRFDERQERGDSERAQAIRTLGDVNHHLANLRTMVAGRAQ